MRILKSRFIRGIMILGFSLVIIATAIISRTNRLPGKVAGTATNPLLLNNKFCDNPASVDQISCTSFIPSVLAAVLTSPYQNVSGDVAISGNVGIGTATPGDKLTVVGRVTAQNSSGSGLSLDASDAAANNYSGGNIYFFDGTAANGTKYGLGNPPGAGTGTFMFRTNNWSGIYSFGKTISPGALSNYQEFMRIDNSGNVGIGTAGPVAKLDVAGEIHSSSTAAGFYLGAGCAKDNWLRLTKIAGACATADYHDLAVGQFWSNGALRFDLAEVTPSNAADNLEQGDIVVIDPTKGTRITKSAKPYDATVYGIVSSYDQAAMVIGGDTSPESAKNVKDKTPVALVGRVKTKVSTENGPIEVGDYLTSSSAPGVAMKATRPGPIVGKALESYSSSGVGKIMAFVNVSWYDPDVNLTSTDNFHLDFNRLKNAGNNLITRIGAFGKLIVGNIQAGIIETRKLIVNGVDILDKLNKQEQEISELKSTVQQLQQQLQNR